MCLFFFNIQIYQAVTMRVALVFVLLFATVFCRPVSPFSLSHHLSSTYLFGLCYVCLLTQINLLCSNICLLGKKSVRQFRELWGSGEYERERERESGRREIHVYCYWPSPQKRWPAVSEFRQETSVVSQNRATPQVSNMQVKYSNTCLHWLFWILLLIYCLHYHRLCVF